MVIPRRAFRMKIGPYVFRVKYGKKLSLGEQQVDGLFIFDDKTILLNKEMNDDRLRVVFIHEIIHAINTVTGLDARLSSRYKPTEEDITREQSTVWAQVIKDNAWLFQNSQT